MSDATVDSGGNGKKSHLTDEARRSLRVAVCGDRPFRTLERCCGCNNFLGSSHDGTTCGDQTCRQVAVDERQEIRDAANELRKAGADGRDVALVLGYLQDKVGQYRVNFLRMEAAFLEMYPSDVDRPAIITEQLVVLKELLLALPETLVKRKEPAETKQLVLLGG
ncbi:MAG: hypothetical protein V1763_02110 [Parcubacteria group bacterium]